MEELPEVSKLTAEQKLCMEHFTETTTRDETGRFVVQMPFIPGSTPLGNSLTQAERRYKQLETRLKQHPETKERYSKFIKEFIEVDHMEIIPEEEVPIEEEKSYYLPHLCVFKDESSTTKLRVVFDGSAKTSTQVSLNDTLMVGPTIQSDIFDILLRFQFHAIVLSADIEKMYRQTALSKESKDYHRLLWRFSPEEKISHLRLKRVIYGVRSSAYHATRAQQETATFKPGSVAN